MTQETTLDDVIETLNTLYDVMENISTQLASMDNRFRKIADHAESIDANTAMIGS